ncbi:fungal hydrophobin [Polyporus arcularius HHB13444]|uniref:Hydrophobin n=2 Tax=Polyporaceae TaxID=5317 RepID=A0A5C3PXS0_9APHY|nr:fungal hydrophobin [Polyporus brumalis]TFK94506.1 fungal hydrophobin [Polyporus arcularius HHB13444]
MFFRVAAAALLALPVLAVAADGSCSTGPVQCCESLEDANSAAGSALLSVVGVALQGVIGQIGLKCSPLSVVGVGSGNACSSNAVCCQNNNVGGLLSVGCLPVQL